MDAGKLDQRIEVRSETTVPNGVGGESASFSWSPKFWAGVEAIRGQERVIADQTKGVQTYRITVRNQGRGAALATTDVIRWKGVEMNIISAPDPGRDNFRMIEAQTGRPNP